MNEKVIYDGDVVVRELGALRRITLNRPKALNAITLGMAETMTTFMRGWAEDPAAGAVMIDGKMQDDATWKQAQVIVHLAQQVAARDVDYAALYQF